MMSPASSTGASDRPDAASRPPTDPPADPVGDLLADNPGRRPPLVRVVYLVCGILMMILGIVGWLVPVVTGIPFYVLGLWMLGMASRRFRRGINRIERRFPIRVRRALRATRERFRRHR